MPVIEFLSGASPEPFAPLVAALREGLKENGYSDGKNVAIEYRWARGRYEQLPALAADLVRQQVDVIATADTTSALAAKAATSKIPIIFSVGTDPIKDALVISLNRPGGNLTGVSYLTVALAAKRLGVLHELVPNATVMAALVNPSAEKVAEPIAGDLQTAAQALGLQLYILRASTAGEIDTAFATVVSRRVGALFITGDAFFRTRKEQLVGLAARHAVPTMYWARELAGAGGLISYGPSFADAHHQQGIYIAKILKGIKPAELPVIQPTKFEFVINSGTAKSLGLQISEKLLALADEVIE
jgi:putative ABC transport system substrate-binding protein